MSLVLEYFNIIVSEVKFIASGTKPHCEIQYTFFSKMAPNSNVVLFLFKLALVASFVTVKFKRFYHERGDKG